MPLTDQRIILDWESDASISANTSESSPEIDAGGSVLVIEEGWWWPPYEADGTPSDSDRLEILIDAESYPHMFIRSKAEENMLLPRDERHTVRTIKFGKICPDPLEDTCLKLGPGQKIMVKHWAGAGGVSAGAKRRLILVGREFKNDAELRAAYGPTYQPMGAFTLSDPVNRKTTRPIMKMMPITMDNASKMSAGTMQTPPKIFPFWTYSINAASIPSDKEYPFSYPLANVAKEYMNLAFDWTRVLNKALVIRRLGCLITSGRGKVWVKQDTLKRPSEDGYVINADYPNMLPAGTSVAHKQGPIDFKEIGPQILAYNILTERRALADPGTTIPANAVQLQVRGVWVEW